MKNADQWCLFLPPITHQEQRRYSTLNFWKFWKFLPKIRDSHKFQKMHTSILFNNNHGNVNIIKTITKTTHIRW